MTTKDPPRFVQGLLQRLADDELPPFVARALHARMRANPSWSSWYNRLRTAERAATDAPLSAGQQAMLRSMLLDDPRLDEDPLPKRGWFIGFGLAATATAAFLLWPRLPHSDDDFVARGPALRLQARCLVNDAVVGEVLASVADASLACPDGALVAVAVANPGAAARAVQVEVHHVDGTVSTLARVVVEAGGGLVLADGALRLDGVGRRTLQAIGDGDDGARSPRVVITVGGQP